MTKKTEYKQRLMHIQPVGACFFVTFRLHNTLPLSFTKELSEKYSIEKANILKVQDAKERNFKLFDLRKKQIHAIDQYLDRAESDDICNLNIPEISNLIKDQLHKFDDDLFELLAYCLMPNHVHLVIDTSIQISDEMVYEDNWKGYKQLDEIMKRIKGASARYINKYLNRSGTFWQSESYDIYIRNEKMLNNVISYVLMNPVNARLCDRWEEYAANYLKDMGE